MTPCALCSSRRKPGFRFCARHLLSLRASMARDGYLTHVPHHAHDAPPVPTPSRVPREVYRRFLDVRRIA